MLRPMCTYSDNESSGMKTIRLQGDAVHRFFNNVMNGDDYNILIL